MESRPPDPGSRGDFAGYIEARTFFFDTAVVRALEHDVRQIVILGAGYDGRSLRYRTPGVQFFEVDHPATQSDKRRRLQHIGVSMEGVAFVAADLTEPGLATALTQAGFEAEQPSQFLCKGLLRYLPERWFRELFRVTAQCAAPTSELAASISTRESPISDDERDREEALAQAGEPVLRFRYRPVGARRRRRTMAYVVQRRDRWYAVAYEGIDPITDRDHRRWHPAADEHAAQAVARHLA